MMLKGSARHKIDHSIKSMIIEDTIASAHQKSLCVKNEDLILVFLSRRFSAAPIPTPSSGANDSSDIKRPQLEAAGWKHENDPD